MKFQVQSATVARQLPARDNFAARNVVHLNAIGEDQVSYLLTWFAPADAGAPSAGEVIDGELGDPDTIDSGRRKFLPAGRARQQAPGQQPMNSGGPPASIAGEQALRSRHIQRQHSQEMALRYLTLRVQRGDMGEAPVIDLDLIGRIASWFDRDVIGIAPAPGDVPPPEPLPWASDATAPGEANPATSFGSRPAQQTFGS